MAELVHEFSISVDQVADYEFRVTFDKPQFSELRMDEPAPLGRDSAPSASRILAAAIGDCLSASLLFCARKARVNLGPIHTTVTVQIVRNPDRRLRVGRVDVSIDPHLEGADTTAALRCREVFEDYCMVTQSVRQGIDVHVAVKGLEAAPAETSGP